MYPPVIIHLFTCYLLKASKTTHLFVCQVLDETCQITLYQLHHHSGTFVYLKMVLVEIVKHMPIRKVTLSKNR